MARAAPISLRKYAKRRGVSPEAVSKAIEQGRLKRCVVRDARGAPKISDPKLADREWDASTDLSRAPGTVKERAEERKGKRKPKADPDEVGSLADETAREKHWRANLAELDHRERTGELVEAKDATRQMVDAFISCRNRLLGVPSRARQALPHLTAKDVQVLEDVVREALAELAALAGQDGDDDAAAEVG